MNDFLLNFKHWYEKYVRKLIGGTTWQRLNIVLVLEWPPEGLLHGSLRNNRLNYSNLNQFNQCVIQTFYFIYLSIFWILIFQSNKLVVGGGGGSENPTLLHAFYNSSAHLSTFRPEWRDNGNIIKCKAIIEEKQENYKHGFDVSETQIVFNVSREYNGKPDNSYCPVTMSGACIQDILCWCIQDIIFMLILLSRFHL